MRKASMTAAVVKDGLTAHMVNGIMDKRQYFLNQISNNYNDVHAVWIVRSDNVVKQYGKGFSNETLRDAIDTKVLATGEMITEVSEHTDKILLRVTIPYKASMYNNGTNCISCHDVKNGDTLGAISMEFDITSMRSAGIFYYFKNTWNKYSFYNYCTYPN
ncbi:MAG: hypothetical protein Q9M40_09355 [Sulfurimonas sp.]|nr:hypothetical protein [Sulfurimonas sp.]